MLFFVIVVYAQPAAWKVAAQAPEPERFADISGLQTSIGSAVTVSFVTRVRFADGALHRICTRLFDKKAGV